MKSQEVTNRPGEYAIFIVLKLKKTDRAIDKVKELCGNFTAILRSMKNRFSPTDASAIMGFGSDAWNLLRPNQPKPKELSPFVEIKGDRHIAVSTPGDIFFHIRGKSMAICYELSTILENALEGAVEVLDKVNGFRYFDGRAIIGFVDGTENPAVDEDPNNFAVIGDEDKEFKGGSYVFVQKYIHDMKSWAALPTEEQEKVIGRRKFNDVELTDEEKPANAHNAVTNIQNDKGEDLKIVRANMPFTNPVTGETGTYFIGYARTFTTTQRMLENMFIGNPIGNTDHLLEFSKAVTGTLFFVPSYDLLNQLG